MATNKLNHAFLVQRWMAVNRRNVQWDLTFEDWLDIWLQSGHLHERGKGIGKYCMARKNDAGPYAVGNVYITLHQQNNVDQHKFKTSGWGKLRSKKTKTPLGIFNSRSEAAKAHGLTPRQLGIRIEKCEGFEYV
jgi:hypothetical protein